jgi:hypothetical protein
MIPTTPRATELNRNIELGSGIDEGAVLSNIAPLFAVAEMFPPTLRNPTIYEARGRFGLMFNKGLTFGFEGLWRVAVPRLTWKTKNPVAPGSRA